MEQQWFAPQMGFKKLTISATFVAGIYQPKVNYIGNFFGYFRELPIQVTFVPRQLFAWIGP